MHKKHLVTALLVLALIGCTLALRLWPRTLPTKQCSEIFRRYEGCDGIRASFIHDKKINDTLAVDVTMLEAVSDSGWTKICSDLNIPSLANIPEELQSLFSAGQAFGRIVEIDSASAGAACQPLRNLYIYSRSDRTVCVIHLLTEQEYDAIVDNEIKNITY